MGCSLLWKRNSRLCWNSTSWQFFRTRERKRTNIYSHGMMTPRRRSHWDTVRVLQFLCLKPNKVKNMWTWHVGNKERYAILDVFRRRQRQRISLVEDTRRGYLYIAFAVQRYGMVLLHTKAKENVLGGSQEHLFLEKKDSVLGTTRTNWLFVGARLNPKRYGKRISHPIKTNLSLVCRRFAYHVSSTTRSEAFPQISSLHLTRYSTVRQTLGFTVRLISLLLV